VQQRQRAEVDADQERPAILGREDPERSVDVERALFPHSIGERAQRRERAELVGAADALRPRQHLGGNRSHGRVDVVGLGREDAIRSAGARVEGFVVDAVSVRPHRLGRLDEVQRRGERRHHHGAPLGEQCVHDGRRPSLDAAERAERRMNLERQAREPQLTRRGADRLARHRPAHRA